VDVLHRRVWLWDGHEAQARHWHLVVRREVGSPETIKYTLSNAAADTPPHRLAQMQAQRFWIERTFQEAKSECGMADYQARKWRSWHHHMALVAMTLLFMIEERIAQRDAYPLLSCSDIETLLRLVLPRRNLDAQEVIRQMEKRHAKRCAATEGKYAAQGLPTGRTCPVTEPLVSTGLRVTVVCCSARRTFHPTLAPRQPFPPTAQASVQCN
jgi:hypothetical protein